MGRTFDPQPGDPGVSTGPEQLVLIANGSADLLSFGARFLANPDLPARLGAGGPFNVPDMTKAYGGDEAGYTDYTHVAEDSERPAAGSSCMGEGRVRTGWQAPGIRSRTIRMEEP